MTSNSNHFSMRSYIAIAREISAMNDTDISSLSLTDQMQLMSIIKKLEASRTKFASIGPKASYGLDKKPVLRLLQVEQP